jgi:DNA-binding MarR family transcriptional regulator
MPAPRADMPRAGYRTGRLRGPAAAVRARAALGILGGCYAKGAEEMDDGQDGSAGRESRYRSALHERIAWDNLLPPDTADRMDLVFNLTKLFNRMSQDFESVHRRLGWTWAGFRIMNLLWAMGPLEAREVARVSGSSRATISAVLGTLERDGLIARERRATDRRQVIVRLTPAGGERLEEGLRAQADRDRSWFSVLSSAEEDLLRGMLARLADQRLDEREDSMT